MAEEDQAIEALKELSEALKVLGSTVESTSDRQLKYQRRLEANRKALEDYAKEQRAAAKTVKEAAEAEKRIADRKKSYELDAYRRAQGLAREQLEAEKETKSFGFALMRAAGASVENQKALLVWGNRLKVTGESLSAIGGGIGTFAKGLAEGNTKFTSLTPIIDGLSSALSKIAEAIPFAGSAISGSLKLAAEAAKFMLGQLQTATEAFQDVSRAGGLTADGMTGLMRQFQTSGMTLEGFKKAITENSKDLAIFGGTMGRGAENFSKITQEIIDSGAGDYLRRLGFTADEMGSSTAQFIAMQQRAGATQGKTFQQLARSSAEYLRELDLIAKVTGQSREQAQQQMQEAMREGRFLSTIRQLEQEGRGDAAKQLKLLQSVTHGLNDELSAAIRDASSGIIDSPVVQKFIAAGVDIQGAVDRIKYGGEDAATVFRHLQASVQDNLQAQQQYNQYIRPENSPFPTFYKLVDVANAKFDTLAAKTDAGAVQTDKLTDNAASAQKSLEQMSRQVSALATTILPNFATAISKTTDVMNQALQKMGVPGVVGGTQPTAAAGAAAAKPSPLEDLAAKIVRAEGGGVNARNPFSSASGLGQITKGRYEQLVKEAPMGHQLKGTTFAQYQQDAGLQQAALNYQIENLRGYLGSKGLSQSDAAVYLAHVFGPAGARQVLSHADSTEIEKLFNQDIISKNPAIFKGVSTVGDLKRIISEKMGGGGFAMGGIVRGPTTGYPAMLHGTEAVVPLPDGKTIPVEIKSGAGGLFDKIRNLVGIVDPALGLANIVKDAVMSINDQRANMLEASLSPLMAGGKIPQDALDQMVQSMQMNNILVDNLVELQRENNSINSKILRATNN